jgi:hypothetical protein
VVEATHVPIISIRDVENRSKIILAVKINERHEGGSRWRAGTVHPENEMSGKTPRGI